MHNTSLTQACDDSLLRTINAILLDIEKEGVNCAIRRNSETRSVPLNGDVDVVINRKEIDAVLKALRRNSELLRLKISYGGLKAWVEVEPGIIKEVDFIWRVAKAGVVVLDERKMARIVASAIRRENVPILPPEAAGLMIFAEKKEADDFQRYANEISSAALSYLGQSQRTFWLCWTGLRSPLRWIVSIVRLLLLRSLRLIHPLGVSVSCSRPDVLMLSVILNYLFDRRVCQTRSHLLKLFERNIKGSLVIVDSSKADLSIGDCSLEMAERAIIDYLRERRTEVTRLVKLLA